jgi:hypothetical protein
MQQKPSSNQIYSQTDSQEAAFADRRAVLHTYRLHDPQARQAGNEQDKKELAPR